MNLEKPAKSYLIVPLLIILVTGTVSFAKKGPETTTGGVEFYQEKVVITISDRGAKVNGYYDLWNSSNSKQQVTIYYPFFVDSEHPYPDEIELKDTKFKEGENGIFFDMEFKPGATKTIQVKYSQNFLEESFTYILTTTKEWGVPLEKAEYVIKLPRDWVKVELSYKTDRKKVKGKWSYYYINKYGFLPERNLTISWRK